MDQNSGAHQCHDTLLSASKDTEIQLTWKQLTEAFAARFTSTSEQMEICNGLGALINNDVRYEEDDDYEALDKLTKCINLLSPAVRLNDRNEETKVGFLTNVVIATSRGGNGLQRTLSELSLSEIHKSVIYIYYQAWRA